mgnify:CR=1 FL=1
MSARYFGDSVLRALTRSDERASFLRVHATGSSCVIGYELDDLWVPLFRLAHGSAAFNVANLQVRHKTRWEPTFTRGTPEMIAEQLAGPFSFLWELHLPGSWGSG